MTDDGKQELREKWEAIVAALFEGTIPEAAEWTDSNDIVRVLNAISSPVNHMFHPDGGGLDLRAAQLSREGTLEWATHEGGLKSFVHVVRPKKLTFWNPGLYKHEANFVFEVDALDPVGEEHARSEYVEELTEVRPGTYEPLSSWDNGYSENGDPLQDARRLCRIIKDSRFAIFGKGSLYNSFTDQGFDAYSAYHNDPVKFAKIVEEMANIKL